MTGIKQFLKVKKGPTAIQSKRKTAVQKQTQPAAPFSSVTTAQQSSSSPTKDDKPPQVSSNPALSSQEHGPFADFENALKFLQRRFRSQPLAQLLQAQVSPVQLEKTPAVFSSPPPKQAKDNAIPITPQQVLTFLPQASSGCQSADTPQSADQPVLESPAMNPDQFFKHISLNTPGSPPHPSHLHAHPGTPCCSSSDCAPVSSAVVPASPCTPLLHRSIALRPKTSSSCQRGPPLFLLPDTSSAACTSTLRSQGVQRNLIDTFHDAAAADLPPQTKDESTSADASRAVAIESTSSRSRSSSSALLSPPSNKKRPRHQEPPNPRTSTRNTRSRLAFSSSLPKSPSCSAHYAISSDPISSDIEISAATSLFTLQSADQSLADDSQSSQSQQQASES